MALVSTHRSLSGEQHGLSPAQDSSRTAGGSWKPLCVSKVSGSRTDTSKHCSFEASIFRQLPAGRSLMASSSDGSRGSRLLRSQAPWALLCVWRWHTGFRAAHSRQMKRIQEEKSMLGMTSSCWREKADVCSYLQSFFLLPAEQALLLGEHLAGRPTLGLPRQCSITKCCSEPTEGQLGRGFPR